MTEILDWLRTYWPFFLGIAAALRLLWRIEARLADLSRWFPVHRHDPDTGEMYVPPDSLMPRPPRPR